MALQSVQCCCIQMQRGRRRRHRSAMFGPNGLIVALILRIGGAFGRNIGRQRHLTADIQCRIQLCALGRKIEQSFAIGFLNAPRRQAGCKLDLFADSQFAQGLYQSFPSPAGLRLQKRDFNLCLNPALRRLPRPCPKQTRRDHLGIVQNQAVSWPKIAAEITHMRIFDLPGLAHQEFGVAAG